MQESVRHPDYGERGGRGETGKTKLYWWHKKPLCHEHMIHYWYRSSSSSTLQRGKHWLPRRVHPRRASQGTITVRLPPGGPDNWQGDRIPWTRRDYYRSKTTEELQDKYSKGGIFTAVFLRQVLQPGCCDLHLRVYSVERQRSPYGTWVTSRCYGEGGGFKDSNDPKVDRGSFTPTSRPETLVNNQKRRCINTQNSQHNKTKFYNQPKRFTT